MVDDAPILICCDGSEDAGAIAAAAVWLIDRRAVILEVGPLPMAAESYAAFGSGAAYLDHLLLR